MKIIYEERYGLKIEPQYEGKRCTGFHVIRTGTGEVVDTFKMLHEAEEYICGQGSMWGKGIMVDSAAEFKVY